MKVSDIVTKVIKKEDEDGDISFAIKALIENDSDDEDIYVNLQGLDSDGFEIYDVTLTGKISIGKSNTLTTKVTYINKELFEQIVTWQDK